MKKPLILFVLVVAKMAYNKYCESKPKGCKNQLNGKEKHDEKQGLPEEGIDY